MLLRSYGFYIFQFTRRRSQALLRHPSLGSPAAGLNRPATSMECARPVAEHGVSVRCMGGNWLPKDKLGVLREGKARGQGSTGINGFIAKLKSLGYSGALNIERERGRRPSGGAMTSPWQWSSWRACGLKSDRPRAVGGSQSPVPGRPRKSGCRRGSSGDANRIVHPR